MAKSTLITFAQKLPDEPFKYERQYEFDEFEQQAPSGFYVFEIKRKRKPKSQKQLGVIFGLMIETILRVMEEKTLGVEDLMRYLLAADIPKGQKVTKNYLLALFYIIAPTFDDGGNKITLSKMTTVQANELIERIQNIMGPFGVFIPDPRKNWKELET